MPREIKRSVCPYDCPDTCGLIVEVEGGKAVRVTGDPEHPYTRGFLCPKMLHYEKTVHSPRRLTTPSIRTGAKGSGSFRPVSWDEAIATIADALERHHRPLWRRGHPPLFLRRNDGTRTAERRSPVLPPARSFPARPDHLFPGEGRRVEGGYGGHPRLPSRTR